MENTASPIDILIFSIFALALLCGAILILFRALGNAKNIQIIDKSAIYSAHLKDIESDLEEGRLDQEDFQSAKNEILKRILRAKSQLQGELSDKIPKLLPLILAGFIGISAIGTYLFIGNPTLKDQPIKAREKQLLARAPETLGENEIMLLLQSRAQADPKDAIAHLLMGKMLLGDGRTNDALHALQAALRRDPNNPETLAELGGTFLKLSDYQVGNEFLSAESAALKLDPKNSTAHFYRGLALWKNDDQNGAMSEWGNTWQNYENEDPRKMGLAFRVLNEVSQLDVGPKMGAGPMMGGQMPPMAQAAMQGKNPQEFIQSMIAQRQAKLDANPKDIGLRLSLAKVVAKTDNQKSIALLNDGLKYQNNEFGRALIEMAIAAQLDTGQAK